MRITKLVGILAALVSVAPVGMSAQSGGAKKVAPSGVIARSDVRELPADQQIIQALNRLTFGPRQGDAARVRAMGLDNWIDLQLQPEKINDAAMDSFLAHYPVLNANQNDLVTQYG